MPVELSRDWLVQLNQDLGSARQQFEVEVFAYGHLPLAYSARCFTARSLDRPKDNCELACIDYPTTGLPAAARGRRCSTSTASRPSPVIAITWATIWPGWRGWSMWCASPRGAGHPDDAGPLQGQPAGPGSLPLQQERDCNGYWRQIPGMMLAQ